DQVWARQQQLEEQERSISELKEVLRQQQQLVVRRKELEAQIEAIDAQSETSGPLVFVSYARADEEKARILYNELRKLGFTPWLDKEDLVPGQEWAREIRQIVQKAYIFLLCLSKTFAARGYRQVEVKMALDTAEEM